MTPPFIDHEDLSRRLAPLGSVMDRHIDSDPVMVEEFEEALSRVDVPSTYRTRYPGWKFDVTIGPDGTTLHLPGGDVLIRGESQEDWE